MKILIFIILALSTYTNILSSDWKYIKQLNTGHFVNIDCWDSLNCFCLIQQTGSAELYLSSDGGINWLMQYKTDYDNPQTLGMLNARLCVSPNPDYFYIATHEKKLIKSTDGGKNFKTIQLNDSSGIWQIVMKNKLMGLAISAKNDIYLHKTLDGWNTSEKKLIYSSVFDVMKEILDNGLVPTSISGRNVERTFFWSKFYDLNFNNFEYKEKYQFYADSGAKNRDIFVDMSIVNDSVYYMAGYRRTGVADYSSDIIYRTKDAGKSWKKVLDSFMILHLDYKK